MFKPRLYDRPVEDSVSVAKGYLSNRDTVDCNAPINYGLMILDYQSQALLSCNDYTSVVARRLMLTTPQDLLHAHQFIDRELVETFHIRHRPRQADHTDCALEALNNDWGFDSSDLAVDEQESESMSGPTIRCTIDLTSNELPEAFRRDLEVSVKRQRSDIDSIIDGSFAGIGAVDMLNYTGPKTPNIHLELQSPLFQTMNELSDRNRDERAKLLDAVRTHTTLDTTALSEEARTRWREWVGHRDDPAELEF